MDFYLVTVRVKDMDKSVEFYSGLLGLPVRSRRQSGSGSELCFFGLEGQPQIELIYNPAEPEVTYSGFNLAVSVDDLDAATAMLEAHGYPIHAGPTSPGPNVRFTHFLDPNGIVVSLHQK